MAVEASLCEEPVLIRSGSPCEAVLHSVGIRVVSQAGIVAGLAELRPLARQEIVVVASMYLVAGRSLFCNRGMLKSEGASLFRMALVTEIRLGIRLYHLRTEAAMHGVAV